MLVPHPCQCYNGDNVRPYLTVAPVNLVENYENFGEDRRGAKDKFALPDLPFLDQRGSWQQGTHVADFGRLVSVPQKYFRSSSRVSCLSHQGLGLLSKRLSLFQLRHRLELAEAMAFTAARVERELPHAGVGAQERKAPWLHKVHAQSHRAAGCRGWARRAT